MSQRSHRPTLGKESWFPDSAPSLPSRFEVKPLYFASSGTKTVCASITTQWRYPWSSISISQPSGTLSGDTNTIMNPTSVQVHLHRALHKIYMGLHLLSTPCSLKEAWQGPRAPQRPGHSSLVWNCRTNYSRKAERNPNRKVSPSPQLPGHVQVLAQCMEMQREV